MANTSSSCAGVTASRSRALREVVNKIRPWRSPRRHRCCNQVPHATRQAHGHTRSASSRPFWQHEANNPPSGGSRSSRALREIAFRAAKRAPITSKERWYPHGCDRPKSHVYSSNSSEAARGTSRWPSRQYATLRIPS